MSNVTFPQLIQRACGIYALLKVVVATIDGVDISKETRSFAIFTSSLTELKEWLLSNGVTHIQLKKIDTKADCYWNLPSPNMKYCIACVNICERKVLKGKSWSRSVSRDEIVDVYGCSTCLKCLVNCPYTQRYCKQDEGK